MIKLVRLIVFSAVMMCLQVQAVESQLPSYLPNYYSSIFTNTQVPLTFIRPTDKDYVLNYSPFLTDKRSSILVYVLPCDAPTCASIFQNILVNLNDTIKTFSGAFVEITEIDTNAEISGIESSKSVFAFVLPKSVEVWIYAGPPVNEAQREVTFKKIKSLVNRQRYEVALAEGNVSMGHWGKSIHEYATELLNTGQKSEAIAVLKNLLPISPSDYASQLQFAKNNPDKTVAASSALIVYKNAESEQKISEAAKLLKIGAKQIETFPILSNKEVGLQVVLIPLQPSNVWFLNEVAEVYQRITGIPVKIRRLNDQWQWSMPDRMARQRDVQSGLVRFAKKDINFSRWTKDQYFEALKKSVSSGDPLIKYRVDEIIKQINISPGQYLVDPYLDRFSNLLKQYRSADTRTMYVGITEANIYSGDSNYVFSLSTDGIESPASILSYYMMLGNTLGESYESRQRLVERIAKELVPATLKQLHIPRSTDPTCPYSYSSGVDRLDQKTLKLSKPVKNALEKFKKRKTH